LSKKGNKNNSNTLLREGKEKIKKIGKKFKLLIQMSSDSYAKHIILYNCTTVYKARSKLKLMGLYHTT